MSKSPKDPTDLELNVLQRYASSLAEANPSFDVGQIQVTGSSGIDAMLARNPHIVSPPKSRVRVASLNQLDGFQRLSKDTLIHKSDRDLWSIRKEGDGSMVIERMFDDNGTPIRG